MFAALPLSLRAAARCRGRPNCFLHIVSSSLYLFKLGLAPQIQDLYGKVDFTGKRLQVGRKCLIYVEIAWRVNSTNLKDIGL